MVGSFFVALHHVIVPPHSTIHFTLYTLLIPLYSTMKYLDFLPTSDLGIAVLIVSIIAVVMAFCGYLLRDVLFDVKKPKRS